MLRSRPLLAGSALLCLLAGASIAQARTIRSETTTGTFQLLTGHTARMYLIDSGKSTTTLSARIELFDEKGKLLAQANGIIRPGQPLKLTTLASSVLPSRSTSIAVYARAIVQINEADVGHVLLFSTEFQRNPSGLTLFPPVPLSSCPLAAPRDPENAGEVPYCGGDCQNVTSFVTP